MRNAASQHKLMKERNIARVAELLRGQGPLSRSSLAEKAALDNKTITNIVNDLISTRIVRPAGHSRSTGGRPAELLDLDTSVHFAIGMDLGATHISGILVDLKGQIVDRRWRSLNSDTSREQITETAQGFCCSFQRQVAARKGRLIGIGFVCPGLVDPEEGVCHLSANLPNWREVPIRSVFRDTWQVPVHVEESARVQVWAERWFGLATQLSNFACVNLGPGIGLGIMSNGQVYRGANGSAGEIGHTIVEVGGPPCRCGSRGCLEAVASGLAIASQAQQAVERGERTIIGEIADGHLEAIDASTVAEAAHRGDILARQILEQSGRYLGVAIAGVINLFDPGALILEGGLTKAGDVLLQPLMESARSHTLPTLRERVRMEVSPLGDDASALGAGVLVLRQIFEPPALAEPVWGEGLKVSQRQRRGERICNVSSAHQSGCL